MDVSHGSSSDKLKAMLNMPKWGKEEINNAFLLWLLCVHEKAQWRFDLEEALKLSTSAVDYEGMHIVLTLNKLNYVTPEHVFEQFARVGAQQLMKQADLLNECLSTAVLTNTNNDYKTGQFDQYNVPADFLLNHIQNEINWYQVKKLDLSIDEKMKEIGLGKYAEILREHLRNSNIAKYRGLIEDERLIDLLTTKESDFLIAIGSSIEGGMTEAEAINHNWSILIDHNPTPGT